jgi:hypothetical protein
MIDATATLALEYSYGRRSHGGLDNHHRNWSGFRADVFMEDIGAAGVPKGWVKSAHD